MLRSRGAHGTPAELVANQVLQGLGGGLACVALQVSAQADVVHAGKLSAIVFGDADTHALLQMSLQLQRWFCSLRKLGTPSGQLVSSLASLLPCQACL
jgi:hypothetical protein